MKNIRRIKRVQLKTNKQNESFLIGIVSAEPDYKLSLSLNKSLNISLRNISPFKFKDERGTDMEFSRFSDLTRTPEQTINLISNRSGHNYFLKKLKNIDYILQVANPEMTNMVNHFTSNLRNIDCVTAVFYIDMSSIKEKNLLYLTQ